MRKPSVFDPSVFSNPPNAFRPLQIVHGLDQFLSDPEKLEGLEGLDAALEKFARLGTGGIVTNVGFHDYLNSPRQWAVLRHGLQKAVDLGLRLWLYDEKGYPSGTAGGIVTRANPEFTALGLACYTITVDGPAGVDFPLPLSCRKFVWAGVTSAPEKAEDEVVMDLSGQVDSWSRLHWRAPAGHWVIIYLAERVMYEGTHSADNVYEFRKYVNLLDPQAVRAFLRITHETYRREIPDDLWAKIEAIFSDEPSLMTFYLPPITELVHGMTPVLDGLVFDDRPPALPWRVDFLETFKAAKGYDLRPMLYALFYSASDSACAVRQDYWEVVTRLYTEAFYIQIGEWCAANGVASSGHLMLEEDISDHIFFHGSIFPPIRHMQLPGIDMLNANPQEMFHSGSFMGDSFMAVKYVTSAAHLTDRRLIHSENSDWEQQITGRTTSLPERRGQANLQYVLGLNQVTSYYHWDELGELAQAQYNEYIGRLGSLLTGGRHHCHVAVLYPDRTLWAHALPLLKPMESWAAGRIYRTAWLEKTAREFPALVRALLCGQVDLDILDEQAIVEGEKRSGALHIANEAYRLIVLPPIDTLALETARALVDFCRSGGLVLSVERLPRMANSPANTPLLEAELATLMESGKALQVDPTALADQIRRLFEPDVILLDPNPEILYTHRVLEGRHVYFFINNASAPAEIRLALREPGPYTLYDPLTGRLAPLAEPLSLSLAGYGGVFIVCKVK